MVHIGSNMVNIESYMVHIKYNSRCAGAVPVGAPCVVVAAAVAPARAPSGASRIRCDRRCSLALAPTVVGALSALSVVRWQWRTFRLAHSVHSAVFAGTGAHFVWRTQCTQRCSLALAQIVFGAFGAFGAFRWHWRVLCLAYSVHSAHFAGICAHCVSRIR